MQATSARRAACRRCTLAPVTRQRERLCETKTSFSRRGRYHSGDEIIGRPIRRHLTGLDRSSHGMRRRYSPGIESPRATRSAVAGSGLQPSKVGASRWIGHENSGKRSLRSWQSMHAGTVVAPPARRGTGNGRARVERHESAKVEARYALEAPGQRAVSAGFQPVEIVGVSWSGSRALHKIRCTGFVHVRHASGNARRRLRSASHSAWAIASRRFSDSQRAASRRDPGALRSSSRRTSSGVQSRRSGSATLKRSYAAPRSARLVSQWRPELH